MRRIVPAALMACLVLVGTPLHAASRTLVDDGFTTLDTRRWIVEAEPASTSAQANEASASVVYAKHHALILDAPRGLTVWLNRRLTGHYEIDFTRTVIVDGGRNDRLSDFNQFWLANAGKDGQPVAPFGGTGRFADYDALQLFYAGVGGNGNTTTRFRLYDGTPARPLLAEYTDKANLLRANHPYRVRIVVDGRGTRFYLDGKPYFAASPPLAASGYFGFRTTASRQAITHFSIRALP